VEHPEGFQTISTTRQESSILAPTSLVASTPSHIHKIPQMMRFAEYWIKNDKDPKHI
jgi:hypothetical protein